MPAEVTYLGIRHHGPGSARRVIEALDELRPVEVLVEGPADLSDRLALLADEAMVPPVAQLAYPKDTPNRAFFWPFATFSPEYQAIRWALARDIPVRYIDLPVAWRLPEAEPEDHDTPEEATNTDPAPEPHESDWDQRIRMDPIGILAEAAGYEDGESWWRDVIEENPDPGPVFAAVGDAMAALRQDEPPLPRFEAAREAHMRLEIAKSAKAAGGPVAVVCGAFHVPALRAKHTAKDDRALLKGGPKAKTIATWAPWTSPRLAFASGYGAGVAAPGWCKHLWDNPGPQQASIWVARIARMLREEGQIVSTASLIETERLATALAAVRGRPRAGFEELREATVACLCYGDPILWTLVESKLILGNEVGSIPSTVPSAPLLDDLQRQQKKARLKPEALEKELSLDLRSDSGLFRSTLLHRLTVLNVPWGTLGTAGRSRGTFREKWQLRWEPEYAVELVESLVYGTTIETAASGRLTARMKEETTLGKLANLVFGALTAQLPDAAANGTARLAKRAAQTSDCRELLSSLGPMADIIRYGEARVVDAEALTALFTRIATQSAIQMQYAARGLDAEAAQDFAELLKQANSALRLVATEDLSALWTDGLTKIANDTKAARLVMGTAARMLYEADEMTPEDATALLGRMLSPGTAVADAAAFFEGFFYGAGQRLLYDDALRDCVDAWIVSLDKETFTEHLPLFRRVLSELDRTERQRLLDALFGRQASGTGRVLSEHAAEVWPAHFDALKAILTKGGRDV
ncbi:DUF5682 family protein [Halovulum sp. GXIMD14793]